MATRALLWLRLWGVVLVSGCSPVSLVTRGDVKVYTITHDATNVHLLVSRGHKPLLIDAGYAHNAARLDQDLRALGVDPAGLEALILTHAHADHAGGARYFQQHFGVKIVAGAGDAAMLAAGQNEPLCPTGLLGRLRRGRDQAAHYTTTQASSLVSDSLQLDGVRVQLVPGHTRGSLVVVAGEFAFVGDLFRGALVGADAATHLYMCDVAANRRDIGALLARIAPEAQLFMTGHFGPVTRARVRARFEDSP